ncbi:hypothetical protein RclHR1_02600004 [Rhizophagus clarus]|uniref:Protein kinase domain-containing protein n=1 Tax=Rhizophagus clarus TaxID=94130 RepID=A0A2Z6R1B3_9GLOM|nr:hypothetical protein RclHR1_02600004 [Rhizophagus clarus]
MNLGFSGSMLPEYKNTKYYQYPRNNLPSQQSQPSSYSQKQTYYSKPRSERRSKSTTSSIRDNVSLNNESIKSFPCNFTYNNNINNDYRAPPKKKSWDEIEEINDEISLSRRPSLLCTECGKPFSGMKWCGPCNAEHFRRQPPRLTSWSPDLDNFIAKTQITANSAHGIFEWIPFSSFENIKYLAKGGFNVNYSAIWKQGPIIYWDSNANNWKRSGGCEVILKVIEGSQKNLNEFINALTAHHKFFTVAGHILRCFGISRWEGSGDFIVVTSYAKDGNLRQYIQKNFDDFSWIERLITLKDIAISLEMIHNSGYIHRDLHAGNILRHKNRTIISDFGLTWRQDSTGKLYGVLPYMAPEILSGNQHSPASDIYSFAMIMYEIASGKVPFYHTDVNPVNIVQGSRPNLPPVTPAVYIQLMESCWDADPRKRPTASYLISMFDDWINSKRKHLSIIYSSFQNAEAERRNLGSNERISEDAISINTINRTPSITNTINRPTSSVTNTINRPTSSVTNTINRPTSSVTNTIYRPTSSILQNSQTGTPSMKKRKSVFKKILTKLKIVKK